jgi:hypothetical protein
MFRPNFRLNSAPAFPYEETDDQQAAIDAVIGDLEPAVRWTAQSAAMSASARPKWRCGAAFIAAMNGKQVA